MYCSFMRLMESRLARNFRLTVFSPKFWTRQCRYTSFPNCVVSLTCVCSSSKNGKGSWCVVVSTPSSSSSISSASRFSAFDDEILCQNLGTSNPNGCWCCCCCLGTKKNIKICLCKLKASERKIYQFESMHNFIREMRCLPKNGINKVSFRSIMCLG